MTDVHLDVTIFTRRYSSRCHKHVAIAYRVATLPQETHNPPTAHDIPLLERGNSEPGICNVDSLKASRAQLLRQIFIQGGRVKG